MTWRARAATAAFGAAAISMTGLAPALAADSVEGIDAGLKKITILNINDFHGAIGEINRGVMSGNAGNNFACTVVTEQEAADNWLFLSAGDNVGGTNYISSSQDDVPTINYLDALELSGSAVGNHEFDYSWAHLRDEIIPASGFTYLGANVFERGTEIPVLPEYEVYEVDGVSIGVIGVVTEETPTLVQASGIQGLDFGDPVAAVNRVAGQIDSQVDVIIAEYHSGAGGTSSLADQLASSANFARIVNETAGSVDAIFTGHTHQAYVWDAPKPGGGERPIVQSGSLGSHLGKVELGFETDADTGSVTLTQYTADNVRRGATVSDACLANSRYTAASGIVAGAVAEATRLGSEVIGEITADITRAFAADGAEDRLRESTLGNLTAQVWLETMNAPGRVGADIGIMNPGGLRADLPYGDNGDVTVAAVASVHPFANTLQTIDITGAQVVEMLEQQWQPADADRAFLKLGLSDNVRYTYDPDAAQGSKITGVWIDGAPIDLEGTYPIASGSFLLSGSGDNFTVFADGTNRTDSGLIDTDAFMNYFLAHEGPVSPSFEKNGVAVSGIELPIAATAGEEIAFTVSGVDLTSLGAPDNTSFTVYLGDVEVSTAAITTEHIDGVPTRDGVAEVTLTIPADFPGGETVITLVAEPSGTVVRLLADITAVEKPAPPTKPGPVVETDVPASGFGSAGPLLALTLFLAAAGTYMVSRRQQARGH